MNPIKLVNDTIDTNDINNLIHWLQSNPRLTKGPKTVEFENEWSNWLGCRYSVFVNSGSSANLAVLYGLKLANKLKNNKIVFSCLSWVTTIAPAMQIGLTPFLCDVDPYTLGIDVEKFEKLCQRENPAAVMIVHALGFPNNMEKLVEICQRYNVLLIEDSCECVGTTYHGRKLGTFGFVSTFSTYYGHHFSTIEGGFICTNDFDFYNILKSIRSHGWSRDLDEVTRKNLQLKYGIDDFRNQYTFYYPGFNLRSTDLQAVIGLEQLKKLDEFCKKRYANLLKYDALIFNDEWKIDIRKFEFVSNFAYPIIHKKSAQIVEALAEAKVECRPLIAGSISKQPFFYEKYGHFSFPFAEKIHSHGLYLPNNPDMTEAELAYISNTVNSITNN